MLKLASPGLSRRLCGVVLNVVLTTSSLYVVSVSFAQPPVQPPFLSADNKFSIDAENTDTRDVLAMIARMGNHNVLVSDQIQGKITVHLKNVTWQEALNIVAQSQGLVTRESGEVTIVGVTHL
jgi:type IV pilus assembly protein PilQ